MIIEEINIAEENKKKADKLKEMLKELKLPKKCIITDDGKPDYIVSITKKVMFGDDEMAFVFLGEGDIINIKIDNKDDASELKEYLTKSKLKFRLTVGDSRY